MDKKIINYIKRYKISDLEIEDIKNMTPMIEFASYEDFIGNCLLLISYGYPEEDLDVLILANPNIFVRSKKDLEEDLKKISKQNNDIEKTLKKNPFII